MEKNEECVGIVSAMGSNGEGIIKLNGSTIFVPFALIGEKVRFKVLKVSSKCVYGKAIEILTPADIRVRPKCPVFGKCGGCQLQHIRYNNQLKIKEELIVNTFKKVANLDVEIKPAVKGDNEFRYRNKLQLPVAQSKNNGVQIGFYAENSHRVVPIDDCIINAPWTKSIIKAFNKYFKQYNIKGYDEVAGSGDVREITVKEIKGNLIITIVTCSDNLIDKINLIKILEEEVKYPFSLYQNINNSNTNLVYGKKFILLYGNSDYTAEMLGVKYKIGVQSFMQVNTSVCSKLYSAVRDLINADEKTVVIDAYSGAGLMTAILAKNAKRAIGVEIVPEAVDCANDLLTMNNLTDKVSNYLGKCEEILPDIIEREKNLGNKICLVLDPPRKGCDIKVINSIIESDIDKIVYVSCKPSTLARDVGLIVGSLEFDGVDIKRKENFAYRYKIEYIRPYDMFAQTKHVETIVLLCKK